MRFSIFASALLLCAVSSISVNKKGMMARIFEDPESFVATFQNADPDQINDIIAIIDELLGTGNSEKEKAIDDFNEAQKVANASDIQYTDARTAENLALGVKHVAQDNLKLAEQSVTAAANAESKAMEVKDTAAGLLEVEQGTFDAETKRLNEEKKTLEDILDILARLNDLTRRRLLSIISFIKVNPDSVSAVDSIVREMIAAGEAERLAFTNSLKEANDDHVAKTAAYNAAVNAHVTSNENFAAAEKALDEAKAVVVVKEKIVSDKAFEKEEAHKDLEAKRIVKDDEIARVTGENGTLDKVREMLVNLLGSAE